LFQQYADEDMFRSNVLVPKSVGFCGCMTQNVLAVLAEREVNRGRDLLANRRVPFNLFADIVYTE
jgi:hypothetical protein